jgi:hypothetical protein
VSTVRKSHSRMPAACRRRNSDQLVSQPPGRRFDPRLGHDRPDGARCNLDAEPDQLALDAPVPPTRVLACEPNTSSRISHGVAGRAGRRDGYVQRLPTSSRCQRRSVAGVTRNAAHARRGRTRLNAASSARSTCPAAPSAARVGASGRSSAADVQKRHSHAPRTTRHHR